MARDADIERPRGGHFKETISRGGGCTFEIILFTHVKKSPELRHFT